MVSSDCDPQFCGDSLRRLQQTVLRKLRRIDGDNLWAIGFGPKVVDGNCTNRFSIRIFVQRKRKRLPHSRRIPDALTVRLFRRDAGRYDTYLLQTDLEETERVALTGVVVRGPTAEKSSGSKKTVTAQSTTSILLRWLDPRIKEDECRQRALTFSAYRWGLLTVGHLVQQKSADVFTIDRNTNCDGPTTVQGRIVKLKPTRNAPDVVLIESSYEALALSGFVPVAESLPLQPISLGEVTSWLAAAHEGFWHGPRELSRWQFSTYFPELVLPSLGRLEHIIRFQQLGSEGRHALLRPGTSGAILAYQGRPLAMQLAAEAPGFKYGYSQALFYSLDWLRDRLAIAQLEIANVF